mgnify:CR=1 FL=1
MIKYNLTCNDCDNSFDSWFSSSKEYEKLKKLNHINCYNCNSLNVYKSLMTPSIINSKIKKNENLNDKKHIRQKMREYQKFIKKNFRYVGDKFATEARSIHYDNKKKTKGIYGTASKEEMRELKEEGIRTEVIPWVDDKSN